jgi:hypothetical protein
LASLDTILKVIAATNRIDTLDPALLRSGRLDRKIEFLLPEAPARAQILEISARKMHVDDKVNYEELGRSTDEMNSAQLRVRQTLVRRLCADKWTGGDGGSGDGRLAGRRINRQARAFCPVRIFSPVAALTDPPRRGIFEVYVLPSNRARRSFLSQASKEEERPVLCRSCCRCCLLSLTVSCSSHELQC